MLYSPSGEYHEMADDKALPRHPVRVVHQRTGLPPATLRAWERRYGVVSPGRTEGGQRLYSDEDVERLIVLRALTDGGRPIRLVAGLAIGDARSLLAEDRQGGAAPAKPATSEPLDRVGEALAHTRALDGAALQAGLRRAALGAGAVPFLDEVLAPFLTEIGAAWARGDLGPAHEHLASETVKSVLSWLTDSVDQRAGGPTVVLVTLPGERHQLGARLAAAAATLEGWTVAYLGADLPADEVARAARAVDAAAVAVSVVLSPPSAETIENLLALRRGLPPAVRVLVGGRAASELSADVEGIAGVWIVEGLAGLREALRSAR